MVSSKFCLKIFFVIKLWLVCYYHPFGSLYDFLQRKELDQRLMLQLCLTAANGIIHLHTDIRGVRVSDLDNFIDNHITKHIMLV